MALDVTSIKSAVASAFGLFGENFTLRSTTGAVFNPATGAYEGGTQVDRVVSGINAGRETKWMNGTLVTQNEYVLYIFDNGVAPTQAEKVLMGGEEVAIQSVDEYQITGNKLAYRVVLNK